jgi:hypothetical protein
MSASAPVAQPAHNVALLGPVRLCAWPSGVAQCGSAGMSSCDAMHSPHGGGHQPLSARAITCMGLWAHSACWLPWATIMHRLRKLVHTPAR